MVAMLRGLIWVWFAVLVVVVGVWYLQVNRAQETRRLERVWGRHVARDPNPAYPQFELVD
jgi:HAMP domain-containing protein